jgi:hypothetical protein
MSHGNRRRAEPLCLGDVCDEDGNVVLILARMELERIVEDRASIEGPALQHFAEAAYPLIDVLGPGLDETIRVEEQNGVGRQ